MEGTIILGRKQSKRSDCIRYKAEELLEDRDFSELFKTEGTLEIDMAASAALKSLLVDKATEYASKAVSFTKKKGLGRIGAAAVLVSTQKDRW